MSAADGALAPDEIAARDRREARITRVDAAVRKLSKFGFGWTGPLLRLSVGDNRPEQLRVLRRAVFFPLLGIVAFLVLWGSLAPTVDTSLGTVPGPSQVWSEAVGLYEEHVAERDRAADFYDRQDVRNAEAVAAGEEPRFRSYTGRPTFFDQIVTSLKTVALGFVIATIIAVPVGIMCGLSPSVSAALSPLIQIFKPISPLAWLPIVTMVVSALYLNTSDAFPKSLVVSAVTVTLCSLWPTLINTALGVSAIDKDLLNVSRVLQLSTWKKITRLVLPSSLPLIFTGLRLSLGVGWMVLIAAEMLAQNPGLGKFVWDEFQNGSSSSLARIMVAVLTIGIIGFLLDRVMYALQSAFTYSTNR